MPSLLEMKAINWFCTNANAIPQLSTPGMLRYRVRGEEEFKERTLAGLVIEFNNDRKNSKRKKKEGLS